MVEVFMCSVSYVEDRHHPKRGVCPSGLNTAFAELKAGSPNMGTVSNRSRPWQQAMELKSLAQCP